MRSFAPPLIAVGFVDASYKDPIGALPMRPKTAARKADEDEDEEWGDLGDDMLPE